MTADVAFNAIQARRVRPWVNEEEVRLGWISALENAPYFAIYNVGPYTFQPWKVVWPEMSSKFFAAVAGSSVVPGVGLRPFVPDHKIYFASFNDREPAYYLCALLNAPMVKEWIEAHNVSIQVGDVFKHMNLPEYDPADPLHMQMAQLSEQAHQTHNAAQRAAIVAQILPLTTAVLTAWVNRP
ncbi:hypothetical protein [Pseudotabrizicola sp. L79]|uniref:hypothetical protein n=1 Tax=Pseudotabrizicola sp. L79 TaxID=3118402 RepID=UPI002F93B1FD